MPDDKQPSRHQPPSNAPPPPAKGGSNAPGQGHTEGREGHGAQRRQQEKT